MGKSVKIMTFIRRLLNWIDREPWSFAITAAGFACLIALPFVVFA